VVFAAAAGFPCGLATSLNLSGGSRQALYRRAMAHFEGSDWSEARGDLKRALEVDKDNAGCLALMKKVKSSEQAYEKKQRALYGNMFKSSAPKPKATPAPAPAPMPAATEAEAELVDAAGAVA
jgi:hypothetical protein